MLLEYNTYCVWLYDENDEIIDNEKEFRYIGCKSKETLCNLENAITRAVEMITIKNNGKYELINDIELPSLED